MNKLRFRSGQVQLVKVPVEAASVINAGDLVWLDTAGAKPASMFPWTTNAATTQGNFAAKFLGVAHQHSSAGNSDPVSVDISPMSVYELDSAPATYKFGDFLGPDDQANHLLDQQLKVSSAATMAIARAVEFTGAGATTLRVVLASAYGTASTNLNAQIG